MFQACKCSDMCTLLEHGKQVNTCRMAGTGSDMCTVLEYVRQVHTCRMAGRLRNLSLERAKAPPREHG